MSHNPAHYLIPKPLSNRGRLLATVKYALLALGLLIGWRGALSYDDASWTGSPTAVRGQGSVIKMIRVEPTGVDTSSERVTFKPRIQFTTEDGEQRQFESDFSHNPPKYHLGQSVDIIYDPTIAQHRAINTTEGVYGTAIIYFSVGGALFLAGAIWLLIKLKETHRFARLRKNGVVLEAITHQVIADNTFKSNGQSAWRLVVKSTENGPSKGRTFRSERLWQQPTLDDRSRPIMVVVDQNKPDNYHVDVSFWHNQAA